MHRPPGAGRLVAEGHAGHEERARREGGTITTTNLFLQFAGEVVLDEMNAAEREILPRPMVS
jgi:hypothetical protein